MYKVKKSIKTTMSVAHLFIENVANNLMSSIPNENIAISWL